MSQNWINLFCSSGVLLGLFVQRYAWDRYVPAERREFYRKLSVFDRRRYQWIGNHRHEYTGNGYALHHVGGAIMLLFIVGGVAFDLLSRPH